MTLDGRRLATIAGIDGYGFAFGAPVLALGGRLWAFVAQDGVEVYDVHAGQRRHARALGDELDDAGRVVGGATGFVVTVDRSGTIHRYGPDLQPLDTIQLPMCPRAARTAATPRP